MNLTLMISYTLIKFLNQNILFLALISLSAFNTETIRTPFLGGFIPNRATDHYIIKVSGDI